MKVYFLSSSYYEIFLSISVFFTFILKYSTSQIVADSDDEKIVRKTIYGNLQGKIITTANENKAQVFLGVPYAQPPVGDLRFKYPVPPKSWDGIYDATYERNWCVQFWYWDERIEKRPQSEDCLYMNIFVPHQVKNSAPYPVLLWVHGGSYQVGGAGLFPVNGTIDNLVSRGMIVILINYRLGALGFMSSLNKKLTGNYGLEDQLMSLKWVKENIALLDGDPNSVTVGGESAGAASVSLLGVSPKAKGYLHKLIIRSGSSLAPWSVRTINTDLNTNRLISSMGCGDQSDPSDTLLCLQRKDWSDYKSQWRNIAQDDLMFIMSKTAHKPLNYNHPFLAHTYFTPVVDGYRLNNSILPHYAVELMKTGAHLPLMIGTTTGECAGYITWLTYLEKSVSINLHDLEYVVPSSHYANAEQIKQATYKKYIGEKMWKPDFNFRKALVEIASDQNFIAPVSLEAKIYAEKNLPVFVYNFGHGHEELYLRHTTHGVHEVGSSHGFDMVYIFKSSSLVDPGAEKEIPWTEDDLKVVEYVGASIYSFISSGNPNVKVDNFTTPQWNQYNSQCKNAVLISGSGVNATSFYPEAYDYWMNTIKTIESLTLRHGYTFVPDALCSYTKDQNQIDYKTAFYASLVVAVIFCFLFFSLCIFSRIIVGGNGGENSTPFSSSKKRKAPPSNEENGKPLTMAVASV